LVRLKVEILSIQFRREVKEVYGKPFFASDHISRENAG
jgi:hypothetical protein